MKKYGGKSTQRGGGAWGALAALCLTLFIISAAVVLILNAKWLYYADITYLGLDVETGMNTAEIKSNYDTLITYNQLWHRGELAFPTLTMSAEGAVHFKDVKRLFDIVQIVCILTGIASIFLHVKLRKRGGRVWLRVAGFLTLLIPTVLSVFALIDWDRLFEGFHRLVFSNEYWLFDPVADPVIRILPDTFFLHCALGILAIILVSGLICIVRSFKSRPAPAPVKKSRYDL